MFKKSKFNQKMTLFFASMVILSMVSLISCKKENLQEQTISKEVHYRSNRTDEFNNYTTLAEVMPPILYSNLPTFPFEALYVVTKEYESAEDGTSHKTNYNGRQITSYSKAEYLESRLIDLYPDKAYVGIVEDSQDFYDSVVAVYNSYPYIEAVANDSTNSRGNLAFTEDKEEELEYISDENEIEILGMTEEEVVRFKAMNELARMEEFATLDDIFKVGGMRTIKDARFSWVEFGIIAILVGAYVYNRALLCASRATSKTWQFYNEDAVGKKCDAFKHTLVNVLLRRNLSRPMAYLIMDVYWEGTHQNYPCDKYMDWHNNYVGRVTKYSSFRVTNNWETWAQNVRNYINNSDNGVKKNWTTSTPESTVKNQEQQVDDKKYIYRIGD